MSERHDNARSSAAKGWYQTASHWGVHHVRTDGSGSVIEVRGDYDDPRPSPLIHRLPELAGNVLRIDRPYAREGWLRHRKDSGAGRGGEAFVLWPGRPHFPWWLKN